MEYKSVCMYKITDYAFRGYTLLNNSIFPSHKKVASVMLYATDRCNCRCKHCYIWQKRPKTDMSLQTVCRILENKAVSKHTKIGLEGGEFILHPEYREILDYFRKNHPNYDLLSNCADADKLIDAVKSYLPQRLFVSLDGSAPTHQAMRGSPDLYGKVIRVIRELKDVVPVSVMFTLTPFNSPDDLQHVAETCRSNGVDLRIGIYNTMEYFETKEPVDVTDKGATLNYDVADIPESVRYFDENYDFLLLYRHYRENHVRLPCNSIKDSIVIYPNGDVPLCQNKQIILGNVTRERLDVILNKPSTVACHRQHRNCNGCWINFHRKYDIILYRNMEKVLPKKVIEMLWGAYSWTHDRSATYKDLLSYSK
jgi:MoaA/NifB/PqqE/SkfB family radical SAM enzyme